MNLILNRRALLRAGLATALLLGLRGLAFAADPARPAPLLLLVSLRGGMDGLHFLSPADDARFNAARPSSLIAGNGHPLEASRETDFRLHAEAGPLAEIWRDGRMAIWPAAGMPLTTRSHFEAQTLMGWGGGSRGESPVREGWLARWAAGASPAGAEVIGLSVRGGLSAELAGARHAVAVASLAGGVAPPQGEFGAAMLEALYRHGRSPVAQAGRDALAGLGGLDRRLPRGADGKVLPYQPAAGVDYARAGTFGQALATAAQVAKLSPSLVAATVDLGGWDTHEGQPNRFAERVRVLSHGLAALDADLAELGRPWTVLVASEFGRRLRANRSEGTDHGRAGVVFAFGGGRPFGLGRRFGPWPGLNAEQLEEGVDLRVATDYREAFRQVVAELAPDRAPAFAPG
ncbi:DUF1501 domain-containing protein [Siccirubricoccus sp. KC 17139]|uniref:DUF1501 domain-containing protein n=1 Tax=Siccirubricoccus soli TaxID=2899147 RepID=A0ABT1D3V5_9PROT|nr:DUF1501 domain-containing protein [Siccirubricoccus soli]MCO6416617.1 DUF1501 domain-containing protein [Siccirubricoccus soli]MCP2682752.1 DUF1501 domain-containing protein [Siccirubricoccus soli]